MDPPGKPRLAPKTGSKWGTRRPDQTPHHEQNTNCGPISPTAALGRLPAPHQRGLRPAKHSERASLERARLSAARSGVVVAPPALRPAQDRTMRWLEATVGVVSGSETDLHYKINRTPWNPIDFSAELR